MIIATRTASHKRTVHTAANMTSHEYSIHISSDVVLRSHEIAELNAADFRSWLPDSACSAALRRLVRCLRSCLWLVEMWRKSKTNFVDVRTSPHSLQQIYEQSTSIVSYSVVCRKLETRDTTKAT